MRYRPKSTGQSRPARRSGAIRRKSSLGSTGIAELAPEGGDESMVAEMRDAEKGVGVVQPIIGMSRSRPSVIAVTV